MTKLPPSLRSVFAAVLPSEEDGVEALASLGIDLPRGMMVGAVGGMPVVFLTTRFDLYNVCVIFVR